MSRFRGKSDGSIKDLHLVFVTDDAGISTAFELLKSNLSLELDSCLTLVYTISEDPNHFLFKAELKSLVKRFPTQLITYPLHHGELVSSYNCGAIQRVLEIVLNCNVRKHLQFLILGQAGLVETATDRLQFLGIDSGQIHSQIF